MGFFSDLFGKKNCAICGAECGAMRRTKIKTKEYVCNDCRHKCSRYVRLSEFTLDDVKNHIEYMTKIKRLYDEVFSSDQYKKKLYPSPYTDMGIFYCDDLGMLQIVDRAAHKEQYPELIRYDQIFACEPYINESPATEPGKEPTLTECGLKFRLVAPMDINGIENRRGFRTHPFIRREVKVVFTKKDKKVAEYDLRNAKAHFDFIMGVHDDDHALFSFGMNTAEKRNLKGAIAMAKSMGTVAKAAINGGEESLTEEQKAQLKENFDAVADANTGGLAEYSRRADAAEAKIG